MAALQSISKRVDAYNNDNVAQVHPIRGGLGGHVTSQGPINGTITTRTLSHGQVGPDDVAYTIEEEDEEELEEDSSPRAQVFGPADFLEGKSIQMSVFKKTLSAPSISSNRLYQKRLSVSAFENDVNAANYTFHDVVSKIIQAPIKEDIHPYGRGNLYASAFDNEQPKIHREDGRFFLWAITTLAIMGLIGAIILMSAMYKPGVSYSSRSATTMATAIVTSDTWNT